MRRPLPRPRRQAVEETCKLENVLPAHRDEFIAKIKSLHGDKFVPNRNYFSPDVLDFMVCTDDGYRFMPPNSNRDGPKNLQYWADGRVIWLHEIPDMIKWFERTDDTFYTSNSYLTLWDRRKTITHADAIEGIHFNKEKLEEAKKYFGLHDGNWYYVDAANRIYITTSKSTALEDFKYVPILESAFISEWETAFSKDIVTKLKRTAKSADKLQQQLHNEQQRYGQLKFMLKSISAAGRSLLVDTMDKIRTIDLVQELTFHPNSYMITTPDIWLEALGERKYLGQLRIMFCFDTGITFQNIRMRKGSPCAYPHSNEIGTHTCLGTYKTAISNCYLSMDYYTLTLTVLEYLRTINPEDSVGYRRFQDHFGTKRLADNEVTESRVMELVELDNGAVDEDEEE